MIPHPNKCTTCKHGTKMQWVRLRMIPRPKKCALHNTQTCNRDARGRVGMIPRSDKSTMCRHAKNTQRCWVRMIHCLNEGAS